MEPPRSHENTGNTYRSAVTFSLHLRDDCMSTLQGKQKSPKFFLEQSWDAYKALYIKPEGWVSGEYRGEVTLEEPSYALLCFTP
jgi:hypothetical protein